MILHRWIRWPSSTRYSSLPSSEDEKETPVSLKEPSIADFLSPGVIFPILICIICTSINIYVFNNRPPPPISSITRDDIPNLRRPSQFIGLDKVKRPSPPIPRHLINYPLILTQVNQSSPKQVFPDDPKAHMTPQGTISPEDRHFLVSPSISTVAQFRVLDYGMESCELTIQFPPIDMLHPSEDTVVNLGPDANMIDIWSLSSPKPVNAKKLSWSTRPSRKEKISSIEITPNSTFTHLFACASDSLQTFEFAPHNKATLVDWWQDKEGSMPALFLSQYATV